jgi:hypothetical protein
MPTGEPLGMFKSSPSLATAALVIRPPAVEAAVHRSWPHPSEHLTAPGQWLQVMDLQITYCSGKVAFPGREWKNHLETRSKHQSYDEGHSHLQPTCDVCSNISQMLRDQVLQKSYPVAMPIYILPAGLVWSDLLLTLPHSKFKTTTQTSRNPVRIEPCGSWGTTGRLSDPTDPVSIASGWKG